MLDLLDSAVLGRSGWQGLQHLAVARSVLQPRPAGGSLCRLVQLGSLWPVSWGGLTSALGAFNPKALQCWTLADLQWQVGKFKVLDLLDSVGALVVWQGLQICNILQWPDLFCNQNLQLDPVQIGQ